MQHLIVWHLVATWGGVLLGCVSGAVLGVFFHHDRWLGGYGSWQRRMLRLGHISFFGLAFLNLAFLATGMLANVAGAMDTHHRWMTLASVLLLVSSVAMPASCFLAAWNRRAKSVFVVPVVSMVGASIIAFITTLAIVLEGVS